MPETAEDRANVAKFTFFESFYEAAKLLPGDEGRDFAWKIIQYAFEGTEPDFDGTMAALFALAKPNIDSSIKGRARGGMGGRPKKQSEGADGQQHPQHDKTPSKTTVKTTVETTIKTPSETPMETPAETTMETDMDMDMDRDKEMDRGGGISSPLEGELIPPSSTRAAAAARAAPRVECPACGADMERTAGHQGRKRIWRCPLCATESAIEEQP